MNELENYQAQLPTTLEEVGEFAILKEGQYKYMLEAAKALKKAGVAKEVCDQKMKEAQELSLIATAAGQRFGELLLELPKATPNNNRFHENSDRDNFVKPKSEVTADMGLSPKQVSQYQQMAQNPDAVQAAIQKAIENGDVVSRNQVMKEIRVAKAEAKAEMERKLAEKERRITELENRKPDVQIKEVVPDDYEETKKSLENYKKESIVREKERKKILEKKHELEKRVQDLESREDIDALEKKVREEAGYFAIRTYNYIQQNGGCVWIFEKMDELSDKDRKNFINAIYAADAFIKQMIDNLGGYGIE